MWKALKALRTHSSYEESYSYKLLKSTFTPHRTASRHNHKALRQEQLMRVLY